LTGFRYYFSELTFFIGKKSAGPENHSCCFVQLRTEVTDYSLTAQIFRQYSVLNRFSDNVFGLSAVVRRKLLKTPLQGRLLSRRIV
jgi:hypothetical protein